MFLSIIIGHNDSFEVLMMMAVPSSEPQNCTKGTRSTYTYSISKVASGIRDHILVPYDEQRCNMTCRSVKTNMSSFDGAKNTWGHCGSARYDEKEAMSFFLRDYSQCRRFNATREIAICIDLCTHEVLSQVGTHPSVSKKTIEMTWFPLSSRASTSSSYSVSGSK